MPGTLNATNNAQMLLANTMVTPGTSAVLGAVAIGGGIATLSSGLTNGVPVTSLAVTALTGAVTAGGSLTLIYQTHTATVTCPLGAVVGATSVAISSFTPAFSFPSGTGVIRTPLLTDAALDSEASRTLLVYPAAYLAPTVASGVYIEIGFFAGSAVSATPGSGTLVFRAAIWWSHTLNADSFTTRLDTYLTQV